MSALANPLAAPAYNGLNDASPENYLDVDFSQVYDVTLTASEIRPNDFSALSNDADFAWRAIVIQRADGVFSVRLYDSQGYALSSGYIASANLQGDPSSPWPVFPEIIIPAGGRIGIDIRDDSGAQNVVQLVFRGVKRYRLSAVRQ